MSHQIITVDRFQRLIWDIYFSRKVDVQSATDSAWCTCCNSLISRVWVIGPKLLLKPWVRANIMFVMLYILGGFIQHLWMHANEYLWKRLDMHAPECFIYILLKLSNSFTNTAPGGRNWYATVITCVKRLICTCLILQNWLFQLNILEANGPVPWRLWYHCRARFSIRFNFIAQNMQQWQ